MIRIYLDNCWFNRPFDDQSQIRIKLETEAKLFIQDKIINKKIEFAWSYILDFENKANPFKERMNYISRWKEYAIIDIKETRKITNKANELLKKGIKSKDALYLSCAIKAKCKYFLTTDNILLKNAEKFKDIKVISPLTFIEKEKR